MLSQGSFQAEREAEESEPERWQHEKTWPNVAGFEDGRRPQAKECRRQGMWPKLEGARNRFSPGTSRTQSCCHLDLSPVRPMSDFKPPDL